MQETKKQNSKYQTPNTNRGITLIALIITIIVMLILVAVTITMAVNGGLFGKAADAGRQTNEAVALEQELGSGRIKVGNTWYDSPQDVVDNKPSKNQGDGEQVTPDDPENPGESGGGNEEEKVYLGMTNEETDSGIGYYVKIGEQYGIIYADLAFDGNGDLGEWSGLDGQYSYTAEKHEDLKKYYKKGTYTDPFFGEKEVLVVDETQGGTIDRFFVMALKDISSSTYTWYDKNYTAPIDFGTSTAFGTGRTNTEIMIEYWKEDNDVTKNDGDIWNNLNENSEWFVPSRGEWNAFVSNLKISSWTTSSQSYWTSSEQMTLYAWFFIFSDSSSGSFADGVGNTFYVRLSATY